MIPDNFNGPEYDKRRLRYSTPAIQYLKNRVQFTPAYSVLDVGCGTGILLKEFQEARRIVGIDASWSMLNFIRETHLTAGKAQLVLGTGEMAPFAPASFDLITLGHAIHWFKLDALFTELYRLLRPGGWFAAISRYPSPHEPYRPLYNYLLYKWKARSGDPRLHQLEIKDVGVGDIVGIESTGFANYDRVVIQSEEIIPVESYLERPRDHDVFLSLPETVQRLYLEELEQELRRLVPSGIIQELNFDYIVTAQREL